MFQLLSLESLDIQGENNDYLNLNLKQLSGFNKEAIY